ncbi:MAG: protein translocase subunit SecDF, partial [Flavobacteriaceae bacterium]|nr:protein translocase subunit SecDF [Flavobacteriaceae bacterium]
MQNKGLIKFFVVLLALVCVYSLSFTFITNKVENEAKLFASSKVSETEENYIDKRVSVEDRYLDSISADPVFLGIDYATAKERELNKGLDLKGGINVILQVSVKDILKTLSNNSKHPAFLMALDNTDSLEVNSSLGYLELFFQEFDKIPDAQYASADIFATRENSGQIDIDMPNEAAKTVIRNNVDDLMTAAFDVIRKRIDKFGVTQPNIQRLGKSGRILVELPGAKDVARVQRLLQSTAKLEFWHVYQAGNIAPFLQQADQYLAELN